MKKRFFAVIFLLFTGFLFSQEITFEDFNLSKQELIDKYIELNCLVKKDNEENYISIASNDLNFSFFNIEIYGIYFNENDSVRRLVLYTSEDYPSLMFDEFVFKYLEVNKLIAPNISVTERDYLSLTTIQDKKYLLSFFRPLSTSEQYDTKIITIFKFSK